MLETDLPILRELRDDLAAAYAAREAEPSRPRARRRLRAPRRIAAFAAAAAAAAIAVLVAPFGEDRSAASVLDAAATAAATQPAPAGAKGTYAYFRERSTVGSTADPTLSIAGGVEWWVARDGSGRLRQTMRIDNDFEYPADDPGLPKWRKAGNRRWVRDARFRAGEFDGMHRRFSSTVLEPRVDRLPTEPAALKAELTRQLKAAARDDDPETGFRGPVQGYQLLIVIEQTLAHPLASPELRAALYRVTATIGGVTVTEGTNDPAGRPATVLVHTRQAGGSSMRTEVFFDPETAASLAVRNTTTSSGTTSQTWIYTPPTTVDSLTETP